MVPRGRPSSPSTWTPSPTSTSPTTSPVAALGRTVVDQAQRRARHLHGPGPRQVAARGPRRADLPRRHRPPGAGPARAARRPPAAAVHGQLPHPRGHPRRRSRRTRSCPTPTCRWTSCRTRSPSSLPTTSRRSSWPDDPTLEWCPPGHGDLYTALRGTGLLDAMLDAGYTQVFVSNSDNLGAVARPAGRRAGSPRAGRPSPSRPYAARRATARAGTSPGARATAASCCARPRRPLTEDKEALADLDRHRFSSTNNLWFDLRRDEARRSTSATASSGWR